jgi:hypothetical protein
VTIRAERVAFGGGDAGNLAETDVLLQRDLERLELFGALGDRIDTLGGDELGEGARLVLEVFGRGDEVGLALELDEGTDVAVDDEADDPLGRLTLLALGARR